MSDPSAETIYATLFRDPDYLGGSHNIPGDEPQLGPWDGEASSLKVYYDGFVNFYSKEWYASWVLSLHGPCDVHDLREWAHGVMDWGNWDDEIASVKVMPPEYDVLADIDEQLASAGRLARRTTGGDEEIDITVMHEGKVFRFSAGRKVLL